jgi:DNA-binding response OmpR family regulator
MPRVLIADDAAETRATLEYSLRAEGLEVATAADAATALRAALTDSFDVIVLDAQLPGLSGYGVLRRLRAEAVGTPVLLISTQGDSAAQARGFDAGADGYLVKPFSLVVLLASVRALLRRGDTALDRATRVLRVGELVVHPRTQEVSWRGRSAQLSPREFALLHALASQPDTVLGKDELLRLVWGGQDRASSNVVEVYVSYLRRKLSATGAAHVLCTVRSRGYKIQCSKNIASQPDGLE